MNQPTVVDLPTELLLNIFQYMESTDLLSIAKSCQRLNPVAIASFFQRLGSPDLQQSCIIKPSRHGYADELTALTINFHLVTIKQFYCILTTKQVSDWPETYGYACRVAQLTQNVIRITHLIARLSSIGSISLVIDAWGSRQSLRSDNMQKYVFAICRLVETSILKGCTNFQILHSHPATLKSYQFELVNGTMSSKLATFSRFVKKHGPHKKQGDAGLQGDGWRYRKLSNLKAIPPSISPLPSKLTKLDLSCDFLLIPPFSTWMLGIMKNSPITSLTLSLPSQIIKEEFHHYLFPGIVSALPNLQEIKLAFSRLEFLAPIVEGLHRLPLLQTITFGLTHFGAFLTPLPTAHTSLQYLTSFTGSSAQAAYLFGRLGFSCLNLKFVNIIIDAHFDHNWNYRAFAHHFNSFNSRFSEMGIQPCIGLCVTNHGPRASIWLMSTDERIEQFEHFNPVSRLTLELPTRSNEVRIQDQILHALDWLDIFRGVKGLTLVNRCIALDSLAPEALRTLMFAAISARYPEIVTFNILDLPSNPAKYHYHWSNACDDWERGTDGIPTMPLFEQKSVEYSVCSHF